MRKFKRIEVPVSNEELIELEWLAKTANRSIETVIHSMVKDYLNSQEKVYIPDYTKGIYANALSAVAGVYRVNKFKIISRTRLRKYVEARHMMFYIIRTKYMIKYEDIGRDSGYNHATIIHAVNTIEGLIEVDEGVRARYNKTLSYLESF